jgi:hypothetical protein
MANPADTFGLQSVSGATWQCWICQRYKGSHSSSAESEGPSEILVDGAGNSAVNGLYRQNGFTGELGFKYLKESQHNHNGQDHNVYIVSCQVSNNTTHWFFSSVPVGMNPGTSMDIDYYTIPVVDDDFVTPIAAEWVITGEGRAPTPRLSLRYTRTSAAGEVNSGDGKCMLTKHRRHVLRFLSSHSKHTIDERRSVISTFFEPRINLLQSTADRREVHEMLYFYLQSKQGVAPVFSRLDWFEHNDRIVLAMLAAWKYLSQACAGEDPVEDGSIKNVRMAWEMWLEHRDDWKSHKQTVFDAGQVHLVGMLVRPFLEMVDSVKLMTT